MLSMYVLFCILRNKERINFSTVIVKYDREFQRPRQSGYGASTNKTGDKKSQTNICGII